MFANAFAGRRTAQQAPQSYTPASDSQGLSLGSPARPAELQPLCNGTQSHVRLQHSLHHTGLRQAGAARHLRGIYGKLEG
jgi:hypothetical protein